MIVAMEFAMITSFCGEKPACMVTGMGYRELSEAPEILPVQPIGELVRGLLQSHVSAMRSLCMPCGLQPLSVSMYGHFTRLDMVADMGCAECQRRQRSCPCSRWGGL